VPICQLQHPILGRPFWGLHPCRTADFMRMIRETSSSPIDAAIGKDELPIALQQPVSYLLSWLSFIAGQVGMPNELVRQFLSAPVDRNH
jgi:hypothetical protein